MTAVTIAKMDDGKIVEIVRTADVVGFSKDRGWALICGEPGKKNSLAVKWVPASYYPFYVGPRISL